MITKTLWKLGISLAVVVWSIISFLPFNDVDFATYMADEVSANVEDFNQMLDEAKQQVEAGEVPSVYVALRQMGEEEQVDFASYFPHVNLKDIKNLNHRNEILLKYLYSDSKGRLKRGPRS